MSNVTYSVPPTQYVLGIDVSKWQGKMDWKKAAGAGVRYAAVRCTVGDYYKDAEFERNWTLAKEEGIYVTAYHVVAPAAGGKRITAQAQMDFFMDFLEKVEPPDWPLVLDCELSSGQDTRYVTSVVQKCAETINTLMQENPIIYTAMGWWNANILPWDGWENYPLWVANYTSAPQPLLPRDWNDWSIWQWSADGNNKGAYYGAQSNAIDLNRMKKEFYDELFEDEPVEPPVTPPVADYPQRATLQTRLLIGDYEYEGEVELEKA